jgi:hypothetical protein
MMREGFMVTKRTVLRSKTRFAIIILAGLLVSVAFASNNRFLVIAAHTPEDCLKVLDEVKAKGPSTLGKFDWGCMAGDHSGYCVIEAKDEAAVKGMLPASMQNARVIKLNKFTAEQIRSFHEKK